MDPMYDGCRLCLDSFPENFTTIDNPELKKQMENVFCFSIEPKQGYSSGVCQSCSYAISEFFQYSEKVRENQEVLHKTVTSFDPTVDSKITLQKVKFETLSSSGLPETIDDTCKSKDEVLEEEEAPKSCEDDEEKEEVPTLESDITIENVKVETLSDSELPDTTEDTSESKDEVLEEENEARNSGDDESYEPPLKKSQISRKERSRKSKLDVSEPDEATKLAKQAKMKRRLKRIEEDQVFNKHFNMVCDLCGTSAANFSKLKNHFTKEHNRRSGYVVCCNKKLFKRYTIRDHMDFHANPDAFRCEVCGNKYKSKAILTEHMLYTHSGEHSTAGSYKCDHCRQTFAKKSALAKHMEWHVKLTCRKCNKMFARMSSLCVHTATLHSAKERAMACDICGQKFLTKEYFERHMNEHKGIEVPRFQCEICQRWLKGKKYLSRHMNTVHADSAQEYKCDICLQKYPHSKALHLHKLYTHTEPKHKCEFCGKKFKTNSSLKEHRTTHTGEALYTCEHCGISNTRKQGLYRHIKVQHPKEWAQKKLMAAQKNGFS